MSSPHQSSSGDDFHRSDYVPTSSHAPTTALDDEEEAIGVTNMLQAQCLQTPPPAPGPRTPRTPGSATKKSSLGIIYGDPLVSLPIDRKPTKIEVVQLYMHLFDVVR